MVYHNPKALLFYIPVALAGMFIIASLFLASSKERYWARIVIVTIGLGSAFLMMNLLPEQLRKLYHFSATGADIALDIFIKFCALFPTILIEKLFDKKDDSHSRTEKLKSAFG